MQIVDGNDYTGATAREAAAMLPDTAGIYIWTIQLARALDGMTDAIELPSRLSAPFSTVRASAVDAGQVGFYRHVHMVDRPPVLRASSSQRAASLMTAGHTDFSWLLTIGTVFQRPLYVGKAISLRNRIPSHFKYRTTFSQQMRDEGISFNDLAVTMIPLSVDGYVDATPTFQDELDESNSLLDLSGELVTEEADGDADARPEEDEDELIPPGREHQDQLIRLAESLLIRNLQPIYNKKVD